MIRAENRLQLLVRNREIAAAAAVGRPTGETMVEAMTRIAALNRQFKDRDPADARHRAPAVSMRRGGY